MCQLGATPALMAQACEKITADARTSQHGRRSWPAHSSQTQPARCGRLCWLRAPPARRFQRSDDELPIERHAVLRPTGPSVARLRSMAEERWSGRKRESCSSGRPIHELQQPEREDAEPEEQHADEEALSKASATERREPLRKYPDGDEPGQP